MRPRSVAASVAAFAVTCRMTRVTARAGLHLAVIESARNLGGMESANSTAFDPDPAMPHPVRGARGAAACVRQHAHSTCRCHLRASQKRGDLFGFHR